jgi:hypothetical protein
MVMDMADGRIAVLEALGELVFRCQGIVDVENNRTGQFCNQAAEILDCKR